MTRICYMVVTTLPDTAVERDYLAWLEDGHVDAVINGGAHSAMIVKLEPTADGRPRVMTQYVFPTREVFDHYVEKFAPALREDGRKRFGPERGVKMERLLGEIV